jgi:hypothetical protein
MAGPRMPLTGWAELSVRSGDDVLHHCGFGVIGGGKNGPGRPGSVAGRVTFT